MSDNYVPWWVTSAHPQSVGSRVTPAAVVPVAEPVTEPPYPATRQPMLKAPLIIENAGQSGPGKSEEAVAGEPAGVGMASHPASLPPVTSAHEALLAADQKALDEASVRLAAHIADKDAT